jgi:hypothetical protein
MQFYLIIIFSYKKKGLFIAKIITGWDRKEPQLFYIESSKTRLK